MGQAVHRIHEDDGSEYAPEDIPLGQARLDGSSMKEWCQTLKWAGPRAIQATCAGSNPQRALNLPVDEDDASEHWSTPWLQFGQNLHSDKAGSPCDATDEEREEWITDVVDSFCKNHELVEKFAKKAAESNWEDSL